MKIRSTALLYIISLLWVSLLISFSDIETLIASSTELEHLIRGYYNVLFLNLGNFLFLGVVLVDTVYSLITTKSKQQLHTTSFWAWLLGFIAWIILGSFFGAFGKDFSILTMSLLLLSNLLIFSTIKTMVNYDRLQTVGK